MITRVKVDREQEDWGGGECGVLLGGGGRGRAGLVGG